MVLSSAFTGESYDGREVLPDFVASGKPVGVDVLSKEPGDEPPATALDPVVRVGRCPRCDGSGVDDCSADPVIQDLFVGQCFGCGQLWCRVCGRLFDPGETSCRCVDDLVGDVADQAAHPPDDGRDARSEEKWCPYCGREYPDPEEHDIYERLLSSPDED